MLAGSEVNEHPFVPITPWGRRTVDEQGADAPVVWRHRSERYGEKLATPDTSVGDLVGDVDGAAEGFPGECCRSFLEDCGIGLPGMMAAAPGDGTAVDGKRDIKKAGERIEMRPRTTASSWPLCKKNSMS